MQPSNSVNNPTWIDSAGAVPLAGTGVAILRTLYAVAEFAAACFAKIAAYCGWQQGDQKYKELSEEAADNIGLALYEFIPGVGYWHYQNTFKKQDPSNQSSSNSNQGPHFSAQNGASRVQKNQSIKHQVTSFFDGQLPAIKFHKEYNKPYGIFSNYWTDEGNRMTDHYDGNMPVRSLTFYEGEEGVEWTTTSSENIFHALRILSLGKQELVNSRGQRGLDVDWEFAKALLSATPNDSHRDSAKIYTYRNQQGQTSTKKLSELSRNIGRWSSPIPKTQDMDMQEYDTRTKKHFDFIKKEHGKVRVYSPKDLFFTKQDAAMLYSLRKKGEAFSEFKKILLSTNNAFLVENTKPSYDDYVWGNGQRGAGNGQNRLGLVLMLYRAELREAISNPLTDQNLYDIVSSGQRT